MRSAPPPAAVPGRNPVLEFMQLLWAVDHGLQSRSKRMEATLGVTGPQRMVIRVVGGSPGIGAGELARVLHLHPSTLTGVLRRLEERGLIRREVSPADARRAVLHLTATGRKVDATRSGTVEEVVRRALGRVPRARVAAAAEVLRALAAELAPAAGAR